MAISSWEPIEMESMNRFRRLLDMTLKSEDWIRVEEFAEDGNMKIRAEMPGIDPEKDVSVSVGGGMLHISARREQHHEEEGDRSFRSEFRYGEFTRDLRIPKGVDASSVSARYDNGILEVRFPWRAEAQAEIAHVEVQHS